MPSRSVRRFVQNFLSMAIARRNGQLLLRAIEARTMKGEYLMASAKTLKILFALLLSAIMVLSLAACAGNTESAPSDSDNSAPSSEQPSGGGSEVAGDNASEETEGSTSSDNKILVAYFSHTGENYNVGVIEKGNTHIIADMIAEETGADLFEIATVNPYPDTYDECRNVAKQEQNDNARPEIIDPPANLDQYDTIFIG